MNFSVNNNFYPWMVALAIVTACVIFLCSSCDEHQEPYIPDPVGQVLCTDGEIYLYDDAINQGKEPIAVVFHADAENTYAVYLYNSPSRQFSDSLGVSQGSSASITAKDGWANTIAIMGNKDVSSPIASYVFSLWKFGQSAFVGSVSQMRLLYAHKNSVNNIIQKCGGDIIPDYDDGCWYWTSTEVSGAETSQAWLISMKNGAIQETPKTVKARIRPIVTVHGGK